MTVDSTPRLDCVEASHLALEVFGIVAAASALPSERDQNFALLSAHGEKFVLKISKADEDPAHRSKVRRLVIFGWPHRPPILSARVSLAL